MTVATILPPARTVFLGENGDPLAGGFVFFYEPPDTTVLKTTWQDATGTVPNANPVVLDAAGSALIYGSGQYLQVLQDSLGNTVWSGLTQDLYGLVAGGTAVLNGDNTFTGTNTFNGPVILASSTVAVTQAAGDTSASVATDKFVNTTALTLTNGTTAVTQAVGNSTTRVATTEFVTLAIDAANLVKTVKSQIFTSSGTYTPSSGMLFCQVEVLSAGGGGGAGGLAGNTGSGGGAGAYGKAIFTAATIGVSKSVTIGAGGASAAAGGNSVFGAIITCTGGSGGTSNCPTYTAGGAGGTCSGATLNGRGEAGNWTDGDKVTGRGGSTYLGGGGAALVSFGVGNAGTGFGSGGGGGQDSGNVGGAGRPGVIFITEYCSA